MKPENQDFENIRRLLKLKRYEQPPPRYFSDFSGQVINRIRAGYPADRAESLTATLEMPWLQRLSSVLDVKPLFAGAFGAVVVGVLVGAAVYSDEVDIPTASPSLAVSQVPSPAPVTPVTVSVPVGNSGAFALGAGSSTNAGSIFDRIGTPSVQPVNHTIFRQ